MRLGTLRNRPIFPRAAVRLRRQHGLTLYEVVLALAIFAGAIAVLGQRITVGSRAAVQSELQTQAVLYCETMLSQVVSGAQPLQPVADALFSDDESWTWSLQIDPGPHPDLLLLGVTVSHRSGNGLVDTTAVLARLMRDPQALFDATLEVEETGP